MSEIALYEALLDAGASKEKAQATVVDLARAQDVATKADLVELKAELIRWVVGSWLAGVGVIVAVIVSTLRFFLA